MSSLDKARQTQLENIQVKTGHSLVEFREIIAKSGLEKHSQIRQMLMDNYGLGYGDANSLIHFALQSDGQSAAESAGLTEQDVLAEIYSGPKASLRPIHDALMTAIEPLGPFDSVPKKGYVSLRRKKQFAMLGPASKSRVELGLNMKALEATSRLEALPPGGMCQYHVYLTSLAEIDPELLAWIRQAYESAG